MNDVTLTHHRTLQAVEPGDPGEGGAGGGAPPKDPPQTKTVDLFDGVKVELPADEAEKLIAARDARAKQYNELNSRLGAIEQAKREAEEKAAEEARRAEAVEAAKQGDVAKATELLEQKYKQRSTELEGKLARLSLESAISRKGNVMPEAIDDLVSIMGSSVRLIEGQILPVNADGKPITGPTGQPHTMDTWLEEQLAKRPYMLRDATPPGSGAGGGTPEGTSVRKMSHQAFNALREAGGQAYRDAAAAVASGGLMITQ